MATVLRAQPSLLVLVAVYESADTEQEWAEEESKVGTLRLPPPALGAAPPAPFDKETKKSGLE